MKDAKKNKSNPDKLDNVHPGTILDKEFLIPLGITPYRLAKETNMPQIRISEIIKGKRSMTCNTSLKLAKFFDTSPDFWIGLQKDYDIEEEMKRIGDELEKIKPYSQHSND